MVHDQQDDRPLGAERVVRRGLYRAAFERTALRRGASAGSVLVEDLDGDGRLDLVVANEKGSNVAVLLDDGKGGFSPSLGSPFPPAPVRMIWPAVISTGMVASIWRSRTMKRST